MISHINGKLDDILENAVVIETAGVGYHIMITESSKTTLPPLGSQLKLFTYHHIREDQQALFGFLDQKDKLFFMKLTSVSGVGPKVALKCYQIYQVQKLFKVF